MHHTTLLHFHHAELFSEKRRIITSHIQMYFHIYKRRFYNCMRKIWMQHLSLSEPQGMIQLIYQDKQVTLSIPSHTTLLWRMMSQRKSILQSRVTFPPSKKLSRLPPAKILPAYRINKYFNHISFNFDKLFRHKLMVSKINDNIDNLLSSKDVVIIKSLSYIANFELKCL